MQPLPNLWCVGAKRFCRSAVHVDDRVTARSGGDVLTVEKRKYPRYALGVLAKCLGFFAGKHKTASAQEVACVGNSLVCLQRARSSHVGSYLEIGVNQARCAAQSDGYFSMFARLLGNDVIQYTLTFSRCPDGHSNTYGGTVGAVHPRVVGNRHFQVRAFVQRCL